MTVLGPWVVSQSCTDLWRIGAVDEMGGVGAGADRATNDDQAISDQMIHERGMPIPAVLLADSAGVVPRPAVYEGAQKEGHGLTLGETSDKGIDDRASCVPVGTAGRKPVISDSVR